MARRPEARHHVAVRFDGVRPAVDGEVDAVLSDPARLAEWARAALELVLDGADASVVAYGARASGKTAALYGTPDEPGIVPRLAARLLEERARGAHVHLSFVQVLHHGVLDLLAPASLTAPACLQVDAEPAVVGLTEAPLDRLEDFQLLLRYARCVRAL